MNARMAIWGFLLLAVTHVTQAQLPPGEYGREFTSSEDGTTQPYRLFVPRVASTTSRTLPLVVVLHGWGVDEYAWFRFTPVKRVADDMGFVVAAPYARGNWWYRGPAEQDVLDIVADVRKCLSIDPRRIYLAGHSMGGWGTWRLGLRHPELFAAIAPMAGFDPGEAVAAAVHLNPYVVHDATDPIVPVEQSRQPVARMAERGISHLYCEEIGYGHASRMIGDHLRRVFAWFREHPRELRPRRIALAGRLGGARDRWLMLVAPAAWPRLAIVDAMVDAEGRLHVEGRNVGAFAVRADDLPASATRPLRVVVDGREITTEVSRGWLILEKTGPADWKLITNEAVPSPSPAPPLRGIAAERLTQAHARDELATAVAELLREHFGAEGCLLDADKVRAGRGPLTAEKLLDAWVYPEERLVRVRLAPEQLTSASEVISKGQALLVPSKLAQSRRAKVDVVAPLAVVRQFKIADKDVTPATDLTIGELLAALATETPVSSLEGAAPRGPRRQPLGRTR